MTNIDATIAALRAALKIGPDNLPLRLHLAKLLSDHGYAQEARAEYDLALAHVRTAIAQRPADSALYEQLADIQQAAGDEIGALTSLGIATALRGVPSDQPPTEPEPTKPADTPPPPPPPPLRRPTIEELERENNRLALGGDAPDMAPELLERPTITFADVGGMESLKERIRMAIVYPFQRPEVFAAFGKRAGGGLLLYGPPGCGKTYIARATAGEIGAQVISVGISDILDMWHGQSEQKLHALFETARRSRPAVLFFDEIEAIGGNRLDMRQHFQRTLVNQFLAELDGIEGDNNEILVIGATNSPWHIDGALRRPGRFDHIVFVPPPDEEARRQILRLHLRTKPTAPDIDLAHLARDSEGWSGADLYALIEDAAATALQETLRNGRITPLTMATLLKAMRTRNPSTAEWLATAKNYVLYSNEGGIYDEVAEYLRKRRLMR